MASPARHLGMNIHVFLPFSRVPKIFDISQLSHLIPWSVVEVTLHAILATIFVRFGMAVRTGKVKNCAEIRFGVTVEAMYLSVFTVQGQRMNGKLSLAPELG